MFEQNVGDGANIFITIVAVIIGFAAAMGYIDYNKSTKKQENKDWLKKVSSSYHAASSIGYSSYLSKQKP